MRVPYYYEWIFNNLDDVDDIVESKEIMQNAEATARTISKQDLARLLEMEDSAVNAHMKKGLTPLNPGKKPLVFDYEHAKAFYKTLGINLQ